MAEENSGKRNLFVFCLLSSVLLIVSGGVLAFYYGKSYTNVKQLRVTGNSYLTGPEVLSATGVSTNQELTRGDLVAARTKLLGQPAIASATIQEEDGIIVIKIHERTCSAVLRVDGSLIDVDESARILFYDGRCSVCPIISGAFRIQGAVVHGEGLLDALQSLRAIRDQSPELEKRISEIQIRKGYYTLYMVRPAIQMDVPDLGSTTVGRISASLAYFEKEGRQRGRIDLRGKNALYLPPS